MNQVIFWELFSIKFMRWDIFIAWYNTPKGKRTGVFGDKYDRDVWLLGRVNIIISNEKTTHSQRQAYREANGLIYWG